MHELLRRVAPADSFLSSLRVEVLAAETRLVLPFGEFVVFPHAPNAHYASLVTTRTAGCVARPVRSLVGSRTATPADLVVPFLPDGAGDGAPLFRVADGVARCSVDLVASTLLTLSRFEELVPGARDDWGRFPASASVLARAGALERPVVDEYAAALRDVLEALAPRWKPGRSSARLHLSHDIDEVGVPFRARHALGHALKRGSVRATLRDFASAVSRTSPAFLAAIRTLIHAGNERGMRSAVYFKRSARTPFDSGYAPENVRVRPTLDWLRSMHVELGVHPSHFTFRDPERLRSEVRALRDVLGGGAVGGRQHHLRWSPESWLDWESAGLAYDSSVGFADAPGFRAGTSFPYRPFLLWLDREAELLEVPLVVMETTLFHYQKLDAAQALATVERLVARTSESGGVFSLLWHNTSVVDPRGAEFYGRVLDGLGHLAPYRASEAIA